jgi:hypothetical protein
MPFSEEKVPFLFSEEKVPFLFPRWKPGVSTSHQQTRLKVLMQDGFIFFSRILWETNARKREVINLYKFMLTLYQQLL